MSPSALPGWFKRRIPPEAVINEMKCLSLAGVDTVCGKAHCPNFGECLSQRRLTFIILGPECSRSCAFCAVRKKSKKGDASIFPVDPEEPERVCRTVKEFGITHAVVTSVTRDDLADGGAGQFHSVCRALKRCAPGTRIELLIPDFLGNSESLRTVLDAGPQVVGHNMETVPRLYPALRPGADYARSLALIKDIKTFSNIYAKSSFMLGIGETEEELISAMRELAGCGCDILTLGQYLSPSGAHAPVKEFVTPEKFDRLREAGLAMGFKAVLSGPLVRSSYKASEIYEAIAG